MSAASFCTSASSFGGVQRSRFSEERGGDGGLSGSTAAYRAPEPHQVVVSASRRYRADGDGTLFALAVRSPLEPHEERERSVASSSSPRRAAVGEPIDTARGVNARRRDEVLVRLSR